MKTTQYIIALLAGMAALSCVKEAGKELPQPQDLITIKAQLPEDVLTKAGAHVGFSWYWGEGDKIVITGAEDSQVYTIKEGFTPKYAEFVGKPVDGESFTITYPEKAATADWSGQTQTGNNSYDHLKYAAQISDVDEYLSFAFNPDWAAEHGGTIKQIGVMKMVISLPDTVTAVNGVSIAAEDAIFFKGNGDAKVNKLDLAVEKATPDANHTFIAWFTTSWNEAVVPANTVLTVTVKTKDAPISKEVTFTEEATILGGKVNVFTLDETGWSMPSHYDSGKGTADDPWIIMTADQMKFMADDMVAGETRYFKLGADIDLNGIDWTPLNNTGSFDKYLHFDGNGHTVYNLTVGESAYASFAGVLYGTIKDVTFDGAFIDAGGNKTGVVAGYVGTSANLVPCSLTGVTVKNSSVTGTSSMGGVVAQVAVATTISNCHIVDSQVTGGTTNNVGGFMAYPDAAGARIENCSVTRVMVSAPNAIQYLGGFTGNINKATIFENCTVKEVILNAPTTKRVGGFAGQAGRHEGSVITGCVVENTTISGGQNSGGFVGVDYHPNISKCAVIGGTILAGSSQVGGFVGYPEGNATLACQIADSYSTMNVEGGANANIGGFIGIAKGLIIVKNCFASGEVTGTDAKTGIFAGSVDVNTAAISSCIGWNATLPFAGAIKEGSEEVKNNYAGAEGTITAKAIELGWSADIWDFSGDTPKIK